MLRIETAEVNPAAAKRNDNSDNSGWVSKPEHFLADLASGQAPNV
jgi:hypothetical protein